MDTEHIFKIGFSVFLSASCKVQKTPEKVLEFQTDSYSMSNYVIIVSSKLVKNVSTLFKAKLMGSEKLFTSTRKPFESRVIFW